ncbi:hypothetical protein V6N13_126700 [Hibiscus sabdariffa]|uniref:Uncharacterized protein n=1 Tax=Hibiscus sabdariffa TaxID=183260 RepID=A0ABR2RER5_9ROSI
MRRCKSSVDHKGCLFLSKVQAGLPLFDNCRELMCSIRRSRLHGVSRFNIAAEGLEYAIAGTGFYVIGLDDDLEDIEEEAKEDMHPPLAVWQHCWNF